MNETRQEVLRMVWGSPSDFAGTKRVEYDINAEFAKSAKSVSSAFLATSALM
jgi:methanogenic corrinoid protein MtbC1